MGYFQRKCGSITVLFFMAAFLLPVTPSTAIAQDSSSTPMEATATQAYIYGFPIVDLYRIMFGYFVDSKGPAYKGTFNTLINTANVYTPADTTVQTPNSDTPYSFVGFDLRAEPLILTLPAIESSRYYSVQFVDQYTWNIAYAGSRTTGNGGGRFLIVGPNWTGPTPSGVTKVIRFDTRFGLALIRTQLFGPSDLDNVKKIQAGYTVEPLSSYLKTAAQPVAASVNWPTPLSPEDERTSPQFFSMLAFLLQFCPTPVNEVALRQSFANVGIVSNKPFEPGAQAADFVAGMTAGQKEIDAARAASTSSNDLFGTPEAMQYNYLNRAVGAQYGILATPPPRQFTLDIKKGRTGGALSERINTIIHFAKGDLPPTKAFWSLTMYDLPQQLLVTNPINRYLINSPMLPNLKLDANGGLTLYIQNTSPGRDKESNWLPAPAGPFFMVLRDYWPDESVVNGQWKQPPIIMAD